MTIGDLINNVDGATEMHVQMKTVNPFNKSDLIYNTLYCGEIRGVDKDSISIYMNTFIEEAKLCIDEEGHLFISVLMEGTVL